jgi:hypothetical protein
MDEEVEIPWFQVAKGRENLVIRLPSPVWVSAGVRSVVGIVKISGQPSPQLVCGFKIFQIHL